MVVGQPKLHGNTTLTKSQPWAGEMAQWLKTQAVFAEDPSSVLSAHIRVS